MNIHAYPLHLVTMHPKPIKSLVYLLIALLVTSTNLAYAQIAVNQWLEDQDALYIHNIGHNNQSPTRRPHTDDHNNHATPATFHNHDHGNSQGVQDSQHADCSGFDHCSHCVNLVSSHVLIKAFPTHFENSDYILTTYHVYLPPDFRPPQI